MLSSERKERHLAGNRFLDRFAEEVDGFNRKTLGGSDLEEVCLSLGIELIERPFRSLHGIAIEFREYNYVYVNSLISEPFKVIAGFHELFHVLHHIGDGKRCLSTGGVFNLSKNEYQAQAAGVIALMPNRIVAEMSVEDMMREFEITRQIAEFRLRLSW